MAKIFNLNLWSKLTSGMEFCARGTAQCALSVLHCGHTLALSSSAAAFCMWERDAG